MIDLDITELFEEIVKELPEGLEILYPNGKGGTKVVKSPRLNYIFGSSQYIKDILDEYSKSSAQSERKFPLVALFTPISEDRGDADYFSKAKVSLIIACSSCKEWSNEMRRITSFKRFSVITIMICECFFLFLIICSPSTNPFSVTATDAGKDEVSIARILILTPPVILFL